MRDLTNYILRPEHRKIGMTLSEDGNYYVLKMGETVIERLPRTCPVSYMLDIADRELEMYHSGVSFERDLTHTEIEKLAVVPL